MIKEDPGNPYLKTSGFFTSWDLFCPTFFLSVILASNKNPTVSKLLQFHMHLNENISQPVLMWLTAPWGRCETTRLSAFPPLPLLRAGCVSDLQQEVKSSNCSLLARKLFLEGAPSTNRGAVLSLWSLGAGGSPPGGPHPGDPCYMKEKL